MLPLFVLSQDLEEQLNTIKSIEDAERFIKHSNAIKGELITLNRNDDSNRATAQLLSTPVGKHLKIDDNQFNIYYKVLAKTKTNYYKISIMEFDSNKTPLSEINSLKSFILKGIKSGEHKFENLARVYSEHPSAKTGGDLGWTKQGTFSKRFEKAVKDNKKGRLFTFDEYRERKHYIISKTDDNTLAEEITVLKVTAPN